MSKELEEKALKDLLEWISEYRKDIVFDGILDKAIKEQATYWMQDILSILFYTEEYDISHLYDTEVFRTALTLKIYKLLTSLKLTYSNWNFEVSNVTIDEVGESVFLKFMKDNSL